MYGKRFLSMRYPPPHRIVYDGGIDLSWNFVNVLGSSEEKEFPLPIIVYTYVLLLLLPLLLTSYHSHIAIYPLRYPSLFVTGALFSWSLG